MRKRGKLKHKVGSFSAFGRSVWGVSLLILVLNAGFYLALRTVHRDAELKLELQTEALTCGQVYKIGQWSVKRYGGAGIQNVDSADFGTAVMAKYLDRLDPMKLLFTDVESKAFSKESKQAWKGVTGGADCSFYATQVSTLAAKRIAELTTWIHKLPKNYMSELHSQGEKNWEEPDTYESFAADEQELRARWMMLAESVLRKTNKKVVQAYDSDLRAVLLDSSLHISSLQEETSRVSLAKAMLNAFDPYSTYLPEAEYAEFYQDLAGGTSGIGVRIRRVPRGLYVEKVMPDSPAGRSKEIFEGDTITAVDGKTLEGLSDNEAKNLLKGEEKTRVNLSLRRYANSKLIERVVPLIREQIVFDDAKISHRWLTPKNSPHDRVSVIAVPSFYGRGGEGDSERSSAEELEALVQRLMAAKDKPSALILDLRGNPGGYLEEAVSMAGLFIGDRPVVGVVEKTNRRVLRDYREAIYQGPLVVLLDDQSASAAEVLAGALKDHNRALVIGASASFGKGTVQRLFRLEDELSLLDRGSDKWTGVVKLTTSVYYSPTGHSPSNGGVRPHLLLKKHEELETEAERKKRILAIPETTPFVDSEEAARLGVQALQLTGKVKKLEQAISNPSRAAAIQTMARRLSDPTMAEAVQVAAEFSHVDRQAE